MGILKIKHSEDTIQAPIPKKIVINPGIINSNTIRIKPIINQINAGENHSINDSILDPL
jgi:hypothetical protein